MTEAMIVEAVRGVSQAQSSAPDSPGAVSAAADPSAVARFQAAMGTGETRAADPVPFASEVSAAWRSAQANHQGILHRVRALSDLGRMNGPSSAELVELQYEVANLAFQQEVVAKVADKSSNAIQTLVKNQ